MSENLNSTKERPGRLYIGNFLSVLLLLMMAISLSGQEVKTVEKVVIGDYRYILHAVQRNETLYSVSRLYDCTQEEVLASNKNITGVIGKGTILKIPDHSYQKPLVAKFDENKFLQHLVVSGDNFYQLKLRYGVD